MAKLQPVQLTVIKSVKSTKNMQRITLQAKEVYDFPNGCEGAYIKLMFNAQGGTDLSLLRNEERLVMRTYTIAKYSQATSTIDVDFVCHDTSDLTCGFAARWAMETVVGDRISVSGPNFLVDMNTDADWFFAVADMTGLPALAAKIAKLPSDAKGYAVIKVIEHEDIIRFAVPDNIHIFWLIDNASLEDKVRSLAWLSGKVSVWVACEFESMRALRTYFRNEKEVQREHLYISSYWKKGLTEDGHKVVKREDARKAI